MSTRGWQQLRIVHISDMHFGRHHFFNPQGNGAESDGRALGLSILKDLTAIEAELAPLPEELGPITTPRVIIALTGDFNERCTTPEFKKSEEFLKSFYDATVFRRKIKPSDIFIIPGNHDLKYAEDDPGVRWSQFVHFYQDHDDLRRPDSTQHPRRLDSRDPLVLTSIIDQSREGLVVAEINSCAYVQKETVDERRGQIHDDAVHALEKQLKAIDAKALRASIKVALIHHHPVVLPVLYEPDAGYDGVLNSDLLFRLLKKYGFHLVLHGHKHAAVTYSYDAISAWTAEGVQPLLVVAGGSAGSNEIPRGVPNTYNVINIKWHPTTSQARINIETRGHVSTDADNLRMASPDWYWKTLRVDDRLLTASNWAEASQFETRDWTEHDRSREASRFDEQKRLRRNFPCVEIVPSLDDGQAYEARLWIDGQVDKRDYELPVRVEWAASRDYFKKIYVREATADEQFRAVFAYYGPTLIQTRMIWGDGKEELAYIFAHFPRET